MIKAAVLLCLLAAFVVADWRKAPVPIFLAEASDAAKDAYYSIITSTENVGLKKQQIADLIKEQPAKIQEAYKKFIAEMEERRQAFGTSVNAQMEHLSADARAAIGDIHKIRSDETLTASQKQGQVRKVLADLSPEDRKSVIGVMHKFNVPAIKN
uniref:DUF148 domain-containing protein n=1 Tax=Steinernema glaseri TaxID=37863 RepID=A0A1I7Z9E2_9BILA